jgi:hypothetical protein
MAASYPQLKIIARLSPALEIELQQEAIGAAIRDNIRRPIKCQTKMFAMCEVAHTPSANCLPR